MRFNFIDRIESLSESRLIGLKYVTLAEEYLGDHFPTFPVLPGVLMVEALTQAAGWLLHRNTDFAKSMAVLKEARNIRFGNFVAPGNSLRFEVDLSETTETGAMFKASATVNGKLALSARLELAYFNLAERHKDLAERDQILIEHHRRRWAVLTQQGIGIQIGAQS